MFAVNGNKFLQTRDPCLSDTGKSHHRWQHQLADCDEWMPTMFVSSISSFVCVFAIGTLLFQFKTRDHHLNSGTCTRVLVTRFFVCDHVHCVRGLTWLVSLARFTSIGPLYSPIDVNAFWQLIVMQTKCLLSLSLSHTHTRFTLAISISDANYPLYGDNWTDSDRQSEIRLVYHHRNMIQMVELERCKLDESFGLLQHWMGRCVLDLSTQW